MMQPSRDAETAAAATLPPAALEVAYFTMELGLHPAMPTYSGGLGVLAGDTLRSAADLRLPLVGMTLLHRKGYFRQSLAPDGTQGERPEDWRVEDFLAPMDARVDVEIEGRRVRVRAWRALVRGARDFLLPAYFLDTDVEGNAPGDRRLTDQLYGGDARYRLAQEAVLGIGGVRMLSVLGHAGLRRFHMNEGHSSLLVLELLEEERMRHGRKEILAEDVAVVRAKCVFTTHTPVPAGHDQFPMDLVARVLGEGEIFRRKDLFCCEGVLNMTFLAMNASHYINGVAKRHGEISRHMFARYTIDSITNGVHAASWTTSAFKALYDRHIPGWAEDNYSLRYAIGIPREEFRAAHAESKEALLEEVLRRTGEVLDPGAFTLGFARRATAYKRPTLILRNLGALEKIAARHGPLQLIFAGKAHPRDEEGKEAIRSLHRIRRTLGPGLKLVYLADYGMEMGRLLIGGVDLWLNTPQPPLEASGTSGMKAALNGVPSLSVRDGWWLEGHIEGVTGWSIGNGCRYRQDGEPIRDDDEDAESLYAKLDETILPLYRGNQAGWVDVMRQAVALNGSFFNTQRMLQQYVAQAYF